MQLMEISVVGSGYVGLVTSVGLASFGHRVICVDVEEDKIKLISEGKSPFYEKDLDNLLQTVLNRKHFFATTDLKGAVLDTNVTFICVGTPPTAEGNINLSQIEAVSVQIGNALREKKAYHLMVIKSTVTPGTCVRFILPLLEESSRRKPGEFGLCMNPEFLREGDAVEDFMNPDRTIIGELDEKSGDTLVKVFSCFNTPVLRTSLQSAEVIKYANNALLATLISFSNEIANICENTPCVDVVEILNAVCLDKRLNPIIDGKRINPQILTYLIAGCGFGGSCLPKDISALCAYAHEQGVVPHLLEAVRTVNAGRPARLVESVQEALGILAGHTVAVLGLAFKPGTSDIRDSTSVIVINELLAKGAEVRVYDPMALEAAKSELDKEIMVCDTPEAALAGADAAVIATAWPEFARWNWANLIRKMRRPVIMDGRNVLRQAQLPKGTVYMSVGRAQEVE